MQAFRAILFIIIRNKESLTGMNKETDVLSYNAEKHPVIKRAIKPGKTRTASGSVPLIKISLSEKPASLQGPDYTTF